MNPNVRDASIRIDATLYEEFLAFTTRRLLTPRIVLSDLILEYLARERPSGDLEQAEAQSSAVAMVSTGDPDSRAKLTVQERMLETVKRLGNDPSYREKLKHLLF